MAYPDQAPLVGPGSPPRPLNGECKSASISATVNIRTSGICVLVLDDYVGNA